MSSPALASHTQLLKALRAELQKGLANIKRYAEQQTVTTYWNLGRIMIAESAKSGEAVPYAYLSQGLDIDVRTLQHCVQFYREYPKLDADLPITWSHYRFLLTVESKEERRRWEKRILKEGLKTEDLKALLVESRLKPAVYYVDESKIIRGRLYTYRVIKVKDSENLSGGLRVDCGFNVRILPPASDGKIDNSRIVETRKDEKGEYSLVLSDATVKDIYTYKAKVLRLIDADTLVVEVDCGFKIYIEQTLRLAGIDAPELRTGQGARALRFARKELQKCAFVVIKTYKADKYDRYLADLFYDPKAKTPQDVAGNGKLLNAQLLKAGLALPWKPD